MENLQKFTYKPHYYYYYYLIVKGENCGNAKEILGKSKIEQRKLIVLGVIANITLTLI